MGESFEKYKSFNHCVLSVYWSQIGMGDSLKFIFLLFLVLLVYKFCWLLGKI